MLLFIQLTDINNWLWSTVLIAMLVGCALYFSVRTGFMQVRLFGEMVRAIVRPERRDSRDAHVKHISSFQAFVIALGSRVGTGNLAGVATAISLGGPGAVFWMWVIAVLGSVSAFVESTLAQLYKRKAPGAYIGGPSYYMQYGLGRRWMALLFAVLMCLTFGFAYNSVQSNTIALAWQHAFGIDPLWMGFVLTVLTLVIIFGGVHRIAHFSQAVVPFMAIAYLLLALWVIATNITLLPHVLCEIVGDAFGWHQAAAGGIGMTVMQGIKRGLFSNEAGEGSAPHAAATATVSHPVKQGLIQALGVFVDTLVVCSCTAFIVLLSDADTSSSMGIELTQHALSQHIGSLGPLFIAIAIWLFAFSSIIGNYYYGESCIRFITRSRAALVAFRLMVAGMVMAGALMSLQLAWDLGDLMMALLAMCNLTAIAQLFPQARRLLIDYMQQRKAGIDDPVFTRSQMPDIAPNLDAWE